MSINLVALKAKLGFNLNLLLNPQIELHVLACGHGDTLLLRLAQKWFLIDCNLPTDAAFIKFKDFVAEKKIYSLEAIILTHPHEDHFTGMDRVIEHFSESGRELMRFCDSGFHRRDINEAMKQGSTDGTRRQYAKLCKCIAKLCGNDKYYPCIANSLPINIFESDFLRFLELKLIPIGPSPSTTREALMQCISKGKQYDLNIISVILAVRFRFLRSTFTLFLPGDMDTEGINRALAEYEKRHDKHPAFDIIKVPHHASAASHVGSVLYTTKGKKNSAAVISSGTKFDVLPDREVMREYLKNGWKVFLTTHRPKRERTESAIQMLSLGSSDVTDEDNKELSIKSYSIKLQWSLLQGLTCTPAISEILEPQLDNYEAA